MKWFSLGRLMLLPLIFSLALTACGKGSSDGGSSTGNGSVAFRLAFQNEGDLQSRHAASFDCQGNGIATIEASVFDQDNGLLQAGGPWPCDVGQGTIDAVAAGTGYTLVVLARDEGGNMLYQGQKAVDVAADTVNRAGIIDCAYFAPVLLTPATGSLAVPERMRITWEAVEEASAYRIRVSTSEDLSDPLIDETTTENSYTPVDLENGRTYYWQAAALDAYGHHGSTGTVLSFTSSARIQLINDITPQTAPSSPNNLTAVLGTLFFSALNTTYINQEEYLGRELWKSNGSPSGTVLVKDLNPGSGSGEPVFLTDVRGTLFYLANGSELWLSNYYGTTRIIAQIDSLDHTRSRPLELVAVGESLFLTIYNGAKNTYELWYSNGVQCVLLRDFGPKNVPSEELFLTDVEGTLFFTAYDDTQGLELWKSDGTGGGTVRIKNFRPGSDGFYTHNLTAVGNTLYFEANDGTHGLELWKSDGTEEGTVLVKDIWPGNDGGGVGPITVFGESLYFAADNGAHGYELWKSDGTGQGTVLLKDIRPGSDGSSPVRLTAVGDTLYFVASDGNNDYVGNHGYELWKSDGTGEGTVLIKDILPRRHGSNPKSLTPIDDTLYFAADDGVHGLELWKSDGTAEGTVIVKDIDPRISIGSFRNSSCRIVTVNNTLYFAANDGVHDQELWKSDGTAEGTIIVTDINPSGQIDPRPSTFPVGGEKVFFSPRSYLDVSPVLDQWELWKSDGTADGTSLSLVKKMVFGLGSSRPFISVVGPDGMAYFAASDGTGHGIELWKSNGTTEGTMMVKDIYPGFNNGCSIDEFVSTDTGVFFIADDGVNGYGIWRTNGSASGTEMIMALQDGRGYNFLADAGNTFYFYQYDASGDELWLWKSDGTRDNTERIKDLSHISDIGDPSYDEDKSLSIGDTLFFIIRLKTVGEFCRSELWKTDGTSEGTTRIKRLTSSCDRYTTGTLIQFKEQLYFTAYDEATGHELWMTDGSPDGIVMVKDINAGEGNSDPTDFAVLGDRLYFSADDGVNGRELWVKDGSETAMVKDIFAGATGSGTKSLFSINGTLFFQADDGIHGRELWESDGTADGTRLAAEINPGANHGDPEGFIEFNNMLFFRAYDKAHGYELWRCIP